eukprot:455299_1
MASFLAWILFLSHVSSLSIQHSGCEDATNCLLPNNQMRPLFDVCCQRTGLFDHQITNTTKTNILFEFQTCQISDNDEYNGSATIQIDDGLFTLSITIRSDHKHIILTGNGSPFQFVPSHRGDEHNFEIECIPTDTPENTEDKVSPNQAMIEFHHLLFDTNHQFTHGTFQWSFTGDSNLTLVFKDCIFRHNAPYIFNTNTIVTNTDTASTTRRMLSANDTTTFTKYLCGSFRWCYSVDIHPIINQTTSHSVIITHVDDSSATYFDVFFTPHGYDCVDPYISFSYELIDYDSATEYLSVYENNTLIVKCDVAPNQCGSWHTCITDYKLAIDRIASNEGYRITVYESAEVDAQCSDYHPYSIHENITLICKHPTTAPSMSPTSAPSMSPTSSCLDYNNETSADGNDEIRQFDDEYITNIDNYFTNYSFVSEFNSSHDQYKQKLIECTGTDCVIHCNQSASCLETEIEINIQNKTTLLLCHDAYSCP